MNNKLQSIRKIKYLACTWVPTGDRKMPLACVWVHAKAPQITARASATEEASRLHLCA